jgi:hypothetical protein
VPLELELELELARVLVGLVRWGLILVSWVLGASFSYKFKAASSKQPSSKLHSYSNSNYNYRKQQALIIIIRRRRRKLLGCQMAFEMDGWVLFLAATRGPISSKQASHALCLHSNSPPADTAILLVLVLTC